MPAPGRSDLDDGAPRYQLLGYLASGGMAELYFARVVGLAGFERHVVLKRIVAHHARDPEFVELLERDGVAKFETSWSDLLAGVDAALIKARTS